MSIAPHTYLDSTGARKQSTVTHGAAGAAVAAAAVAGVAGAAGVAAGVGPADSATCRRTWKGGTQIRKVERFRSKT